MNPLALLGLGEPEAAAVVGGVGVLGLFVGLYLMVIPDLLGRRLSSFVGSYRRDLRPAADPTQGSPELMAALERQLMRRKASASIRMLLVRAGLPLTVSEFVVLRAGAAVAAGAAAGLYLLFTIKIGVVAVALGIVAALLGSYLPVAFAQAKARRRLTALEAQLPDALDMVAASLQAGSGLGQAFELLSREMAPPISEEFRRVMHEIGLGLSTTEALTSLADRIGSEDLDLVVTSINIQTRIGGNLVHVLHTITNTIRERIRIRGEIRVLTATQRLSAIVISVLPPAMAVILFLMSPRYMGRLLDPGMTRCMLVAGVLMMIAGILSLRKITQIEV